MNIHIQKANLNDYESVNKLMSQVQELHVRLRPDLYKNTDIVFTLEDYKNMLNEFNFIIAKNKNEILGLLYYKEVEYSKLAHVKRRVYFIDTIVVDKLKYKRGIGNLLLEYVKKEKQKNNVDGIELQVSSHNVNAIEFYRKNGFKEKNKYMELF